MVYGGTLVHTGGSSVEAAAAAAAKAMLKCFCTGGQSQCADDGYRHSSAGNLPLH
jgi:hypothetical protein